jgi:uncharacterized membrane protein
MKNKSVGWLIIGLSVVIGFIVLLFNLGLKKIVGQTCSHGPTCTMYDTISVQTWISVGIAALILVIGLFLVFSKESEKIIVKTKIKQEKKKPINLSGLDSKEKEVIKLIEKENAIFQRTLMEKLNIGKVGITRLLDKLEAKQLIERKRRGMNNIIVLKQQ